MIAELEVAWSGALEARGAAGGLSTYDGRSSLHHSASWALAEARVEDAIDKRRRTRLRGSAKARTVPAQRAKARAWPPLDEARSAAILAQLKHGASYRAISVALEASVDQVRRVGAAHGIDRSMLAPGRRRAAL